MSERLTLYTERLELRIAHPDDAIPATEFRIRNRDFLAPWLPLQANAAFVQDANRQFMQEEWQDFQKGQSYRFLGFLQDDPQQVILDFRFSNVVRGAFRSCFLGYLQDEAHCGKGYMFEALNKGIWYMFAQENLHRIEANIMPRNAPSIKLALKLGFQKEGYSPRFLNIHGEWEDHERYALLNE